MKNSIKTNSQEYITFALDVCLSVSIDLICYRSQACFGLFVHCNLLEICKQSTLKMVEK